MPQPELPLGRRALLRAPVLGAAATSAASLAVLGAPEASAAAPARQVTFRHWQGFTLFGSGSMRGVKLDAQGRLVLHGAPTERLAVNGRTYVGGAWATAWVREGYGFTELIPSWVAHTPGDTFLLVEVRGRNAAGATSSWDWLARWAAWDRSLRRTSFDAQSDDLASVAVDTWRAKAPAGLRDFQLRVRLMRRETTNTSPTVTGVSVMTSRVPSSTSASAPLGIVKTLDVPRYSQMIHTGHYPQFGNGGEVWCSPTAISMVLGYYRKLPAPSEYVAVPAGHPDPWVDHAARATYDTAFGGCGNWSFGTAYAGPRTGHAFVTRLRSLREAEEFIAYNIPLVASISFGRGQLSGAPIAATQGHLLTIVGFAANGDVVTNDPAAPSNSSVRRTYRRAQFEAAWQRRSGGLVYVIRDAQHPLPPRGTRRNW